MEFQLHKVRQAIPDFYNIINNVIQTAYKRAEVQPLEFLSNSLCMSKMYGVLSAYVDYEVMHTLENYRYPDVSMKIVENSQRSAKHLEIHTQYAIFVLAKVRKYRDVPCKAAYRQKYVDQTFMQEARPDLAMYDNKCAPLYVISHISRRPNYHLQGIQIGRLTEDMRAWSCCYNLDTLLIDNTVTVKKEELGSLKENIQRKKDRAKLKKA